MTEGTYNLEEIIEMAIQIEVCGGSFYKALKEKAELPEVRGLFAWLEKEEKGHIRDFSRILSAAKAKKGGYTYSTTHEALLYLRGFAERRVFRDPEHAACVALGFSTAAEGIAFAIDFERKNIEFFREMLARLENPDDRGEVEQLIQAEVDHEAKLAEFARKLPASRRA